MLHLPPAKFAEIAVFRRAGQKIAELASLIATLQTRRPRAVVEIGTDRGGTFWLWCQLAAPNAVLVSIDMPGGDYGVGYTSEDAQRFRGWRQPDQEVHFLLKDSHDPATKLELQRVLNSRPVDLLFLDGDHTYEGTSQDFAMYAPLVGTGGAIVFHDIVETLPHLNCHVHRFWQEIKARYAYEEFIDSEDDLSWRVDQGLSGPWGGIGILHI